MKKRIISFAMLFMLFISAVSAQSVKVRCESTVDSAGEIAQISVSTDESAPALSESDIIFYVKDCAEKYKASGVKKIVLNLESGIVNEDNIASIVNQIDCINVSGAGNAHITGNSIITYSTTEKSEAKKDGADISYDDTNKSSSQNKLNSIIYTTLTLLAIALIALFAAKKSKKKNE